MKSSEIILVGGGGLKPGSIRFLSTSPNRFNVASSRAQKMLHVFGDMEDKAQ